MGSIFRWLDQSEQQRRQMLDMLALFNERETIDELGLGTIRNAFADLLFPGTSAPQTRARYLLFIPWMYLHFERKKTPSAEIGRKARKFELDLVAKLLDAGEKDGAIGRLAGARLQRLPSAIYWSGLKRLGILRTVGSQERYQIGLDRYYQRPQDMRTDDGEPLDGHRGHWHTKLPEAPDRFMEQPTFALRRQDAEYLRDQIQLNAPNTLYAAMVGERERPDPTSYPWEYPSYFTHSATIRRQVTHAQYFSEVMHGATLLYNLILAELTKQDERQTEYDDRLQEWADLIRSRGSALTTWDLDDFWRCALAEGARVSGLTKAFVIEWCRVALSADPKASATSKHARHLVANRERALKRQLARVDNQRARERWGGAAGTARMVYRWPNAVQIATDIVEGLWGKNDA